jgi:hypothetical protein
VRAANGTTNGNSSGRARSASRLTWASRNSSAEIEREAITAEAATQHSGDRASSRADGDGSGRSRAAGDLAERRGEGGADEDPVAEGGYLPGSLPPPGDRIQLTVPTAAETLCAWAESTSTVSA